MSTVNNRVTNMTDQQVALDRMRYNKNAFSSRLVLLSILFDIVYFVAVYQTDASSFYYSALIGASVIYNLIFLLASFLAEEGVKNRKSNYDVALIVIGLLQVVRIFILPMQAWNYQYTVSGETLRAMSTGKFTLVCVCLVASAVCSIVAGVTSGIQNKKLTAYLASMKTEGGLR